MSTVKSLPSSATICYCNQVTKGDITQAIQNGATTVETLHHLTGAGFGGRCKELHPEGRCCHSDILQLLELSE